MDIRIALLYFSQLIIAVVILLISFFSKDFKYLYLIFYIEVLIPFGFIIIKHHSKAEQGRSII